MNTARILGPAVSGAGHWSPSVPYMALEHRSAGADVALEGLRDPNSLASFFILAGCPLAGALQKELNTDLFPRICCSDGHCMDPVSPEP